VPGRDQVFFAAPPPFPLQDSKKKKKDAVQLNAKEKVQAWSVVWNMTFMTFHILIQLGRIIIPTDELIFFQTGGEKPPTRGG